MHANHQLNTFLSGLIVMNLGHVGGLRLASIRLHMYDKYEITLAYTISLSCDVK